MERDRNSCGVVVSGVPKAMGTGNGIGWGRDSELGMRAVISDCVVLDEQGRERKESDRAGHRLGKKMQDN